jgi:6-phosphogluconolactonase
MNIIQSNRKSLEKSLVELVDFAILQNQDEYFYLALPGGNSIRNILEELSNLKTDWSKIKILLTDEREVDPESSESNLKLINDLLISKINIPENNIIKPEIGFVPEKIDFIILSAGEDGHIASLFPNHPSIKDEALGYIRVENSPKPPADRFSLSKNTISKSKNAALLFFGEEKYDAFQEFNNPLLSEIECPAKLLDSIEKLTVLVDVLK